MKNCVMATVLFMALEDMGIDFGSPEKRKSVMANIQCVIDGIVDAHSVEIQKLEKQLADKKRREKVPKSSKIKALSNAKNAVK